MLIATTIITNIIDKYLFSDIEFIILLSIIVAIDTCLGVLLSINRKQLSSNKFGKLFTKLIVYLLLLISTHILATFEVNNNKIEIFKWVDAAIYSSIMLREFLSIIEKAALLGVTLPSWVTNKLLELNKGQQDPPNSSSAK